MTVSIRRMSLGSGFRYLMESVAKADGAVDQSSSLTRYYAESGTPPGRYLGAGLAGIDGGSGVPAGTEVTEEALWRMLGMLVDPVSGEPLGRSPNKMPRTQKSRIDARIAGLDPSMSSTERARVQEQIITDERSRQGTLKPPVAGFDLTFSVPKSVSAAWAVADEGTKAVIYAAHQEAIARTVKYAEAYVFHSRSGTNGVTQENVQGVIAAGFDHWDSRAGDPHLHTHVVVMNRAQTDDGAWRTLDSRGLFKHVVTLSELHEGVLTDLLADTLGWGFDERARKHSPDPRHQVEGVGDQLIAEFSQRAAQIEQSTDLLIAAYVEAHGRRPGGSTLLRLRQQATLEDRPDKHHHSLAELAEQWRDRAIQHVGADPVSWVETLRDRNELPRLRRDDFADDMLRDAGSVATEKVAAKKATFSRANVLAEVHRQLHGVRFATPDERIAVAERTADLALADVLLVSAPELHRTPARFKRSDGSSRFRGLGAEVYTTKALLDAEDRLLNIGRREDGPVVDRAVVAEVCDRELPGKTYGLSADQAAAVDAIATSGRVLDVLVGPAGTGKSTSMAGLRAAWEQQYGAGSVLGLAPSAGAAEVLGDELGIDTENTAKWLTETARQPERLQEIARLNLERLLQAANPSGLRSVTRRIDRLTTEVERWRMKSGQLVIVDEASLAGTFALDELVAQADDAGAKVLLVGDWAQLSAVEAGGAFSMLVRDRYLVPELVDVRRFTNDWEKAASIDLRVGSSDAIAVYTEHGRIVGGSREAMLDALYGAWREDISAGKTSLMIAGDAATVSDLNARARDERIAAGEVESDGIAVASGGTAGVGDQVVTRENNRRIATGKRWVKNGDQWTVEAINADGSIVVKRVGGGGEVVLPTTYVRDHVELAYASTAHRAQGKTVDTAHAMITATTSREVAYVAATRGRESNRLYVDTMYDPDHDTSHGPVIEQTPDEILHGVLANIGADVSAHETINAELDTATNWVTLAAEYQTIAKAAQAERYDALVESSGLTSGEFTEVRESEAYGPLLVAIRDAEARGLDVTTALPALVQGRTFVDAEDIAAVLHARVDRWVAASGGRRTAASRFIAGLVPVAVGVDDPDMAKALTERAQAMEARARTLAEQAIERREPWAVQLGSVPADPIRREAFMREVSTVAAFRDRWNVTGRAVLPADEPGSIERLGHHKRAQAAAERGLALSRQARESAATPWEAATIDMGGPGL